MSCDAYQQAIVDEGSPRPPGLEAHLASCGACQGFRRAHGGALLLRGAAPVVARRAVPAWFSLQAVGVRALAGAAVAGAVLLFWGGAWLSPPVKVNAAEAPGAKASPGEPPVKVHVEVASPSEVAPLPVAPSDDAELRALAGLRDEVEGVARRDLMAADELYRPFGALALWVAPETTHPLRSLGRADFPFVSPKED